MLPEVLHGRLLRFGDQQIAEQPFLLVILVMAVSMPMMKMDLFSGHFAERANLL